MFLYMRHVITLGYTFLFLTPIVVAQIHFEEVSSRVGVGVGYGFGYLGGGISFCDFNQDGWDDLTISSEDGRHTKFYKNQQGRFMLEPLNIPDTYQTKQVQWVDYDNDGDKDFFATSDSGLNILYENDGSFYFTDVTTIAGLHNEALNAFGSCWGDYNNDGWLDVFICYRNLGETQPNTLYKNNGDGTFTDVTAVAGLHLGVDPSFCAAFFDYNKDGYQDIYIANDRFTVRNVLYKNNGDGTFSDESEASGADLLMAAMSVTVADYNKDGWLDIYITNVYNPDNPDVFQTNALLQNNGDGTFSEVALETGTSFNSIAWGAVFLDADNDTDLDLYVSGMLTEPESIPSAFYENHLNTFSIPSGAGFDNDTAVSFSNAIGDFNNDGLTDIAVLNEDNANIFLWENQSTTGANWLKVNLEGTTSNRDGIGAWIEIGIGNDKQYRYTLCGEGYLGQNAGTSIFGLGTAKMVDYVKIDWLGGGTDIHYNIAANQSMQFVEGAALATHTLDPGLVNDVVVFPNPSQDFLHITSTAIDKSYKLSLVGIGGEIVLEKHLTGSIAPIDISHLANGMYILKIGFEDELISKKIMILRD
ncbi:MAG: FG-GAP-like repeat-containing protein [Saprospiraceae bacterium]